MAKKLGLEEAREVVETMLNAASGKSLHFVAAVFDSGGKLVFMARMDGASALNAGMSVNKTYTTAKWGHEMKAIKERLLDMSLGGDRRDIAWFGDPRFAAVWGGIVLRSADGAILGVPGESGGTLAQDEEIVQVGAGAFARS